MLSRLEGLLFALGDKQFSFWPLKQLGYAWRQVDLVRLPFWRFILDDLAAELAGIIELQAAIATATVGPLEWEYDGR